MSPKVFRAAAGILLTCFLLATPVAAGGLANTPWPKLSYDLNASSQSPYIGPQSASLMWTLPLGSHANYNHGGVAIGSDGTLYTGGGNGTVYAVDPNGTVKWSQNIGYVSDDVLYNDQIICTPAIGSDGTIYFTVAANLRYLVAMNPDGTMKWRYQSRNSTTSANMLGSPTIGPDGDIYFATGAGTTSGALTAIKPDGTLNWSYTGTSSTPGSIFVSPLVGPDGTIYVGNRRTSNAYVYAINPDGTRKWATTTSASTLDMVMGPVDQTIYATNSGTTGLRAITPGTSSATMATILSGLSIGWSSGGASLAVAKDGTIYGEGGSTLYAITPGSSSATSKWTYSAGGNIYPSTPAIGSDGTVYFGSTDMNIYAVNSAGSLVWSYPTSEAVRGAPSIGPDGSLYIKGLTTLYAFAGVVNFTADKTRGANPLTVQFTDTSSVMATGWLWDFGDGSTSTDQNPSYQYTTAGFYPVTLTVTHADGTTNYLTRTAYIAVYDLPGAGFTADTTSGKAPLTVQFTDTSTKSPTAWIWDFNDDGIADNTTQNPACTYQADGSYSVNFTATNSGGSSYLLKSGYITVDNPDPPVARFTVNTTVGKTPAVIQFNDTSTGHNITQWSWDFGDGSRSTIRNATHMFTTAGSFTVALNVTNDGGSNTITKPAYISITESLLPVASFTANATSGGPTLAVQFTDTSRHDPIGWLWDFGDGTTSTEQNPVHTYSYGSYSVTLAVTNADGSDSVTKTDFIGVTKYGPLPSYHFFNIYVANDEGVKYDVPDGVYAGGGDYRYVPNTYWVMFRNTGGGLNPMHISSTRNEFSSQDITTTTDQSGSFWITFNGGQTTMPEAVLMLAVNGSIPDDFKVHIRSSGQEFDVGSPSNANQYQSGPPGVSTFLEGDAATNQTFEKNDFIYGPQSWKPCSSEGYPIYAGENQTDPINQFRLMFIDLRVGAIQNASIPNNGMIKVEYSFTNLSSTAVFNSYGWYMQCNHGTGIIMTNNVDNSGFTVNPILALPVANFTATPTAAYILSPVQFNDTSTNSPHDWAWDFGDGGTSTDKNPLHTYTTAGTYTVTLTATNTKGTDTETKTDYITVSTPPSPVASFTANTTTGTIPLAVQFTDTSGNGAISWSWDFGDGGTSAVQDPVHSYSTAGNYTVSLTVTNAAGTDTASLADYISAQPPRAPVAAFTANPVYGIAPLTVTFIDASANSPTSWLWDFGDGTTSTYRNATHTYGSNGTYTVDLTATNSFGTDNLTRNGFVYVTDATGPLPGNSGIYVRAANDEGIRWDTTGNGTYYIQTGASGGGLNVIHVTTDPAVPAGQVTTTNSQSGTFYVTGASQDEIVLLVAVNGTVPDDFAAHIRTSGYTWTPTGSTPAPGYTYQSTALDQSFTKDDFFYGPQNWKPTQGDANYPLFYGEDMASPLNQDMLMFVDTRAGLLNDNTLINNGAVRIDYTFTSLPDNAHFNVYGWKTTSGMGWTNQLTGSGSSGYTVIPSSIVLPPVARFSAAQTAGIAPFTARLTDTSLNNPTRWSWELGEGSTSAVRNATFTYSSPGTYTVNLTAENSAGNDTLSRADYITVTGPVSSTAQFVFPGIWVVPNGAGQDVLIDTTNATVAGNIVTVTRIGSGWDHIAITLTGPPVLDGSNWTGTIGSAQIMTVPFTVPIVSLGTPDGNLTLNLARLPDPGASLTTTIASDPAPGTQGPFTNAATAAGRRIDATAYTVNFTKDGLDTGGIITDANIAMAVNRSWVDAYGGTSHIVIMMYRYDYNTATILTTTYAGTDADGNAVFTAPSIPGFSTFVLTAVSQVTLPVSPVTGGAGGNGPRVNIVSTTPPPYTYATPTPTITTAPPTTAPTPVPTPTTAPRVRITPYPTGTLANETVGAAANPVAGSPLLRSPWLFYAEIVAAIAILCGGIIIYRRRRTEQYPSWWWNEE